MPTLPWTTADAPASDTTVLVMGSRLALRSLRDVPAFLGAAMKVRRQALHSGGAHGVSLIAQPTRKTFWTLSAWADRAALDAFVGTPPHTEVMKRFGGRLADTGFAFWEVPASELPKSHSNARDLWRDAKKRLSTTSGAGAHR